MQQGGISHVTSTYAQALYEIGLEHKNLTKLEENFSDFIQTFNTNEQFCLFIEAPQIANVKKKELIKNVFEKYFEDDFLHFLYIVIKKRRQFYLPRMLDFFVQLTDEFKGRLRIKTVSAIELDEELKNDIKRILSEKLNKDIIIEPIIDENIMGGIMLKIKDILVDGSIKNHLFSLRNRMLKEKIDKKVLKFVIE